MYVLTFGEPLTVRQSPGQQTRLATQIRFACQNTQLVWDVLYWQAKGSMQENSDIQDLIGRTACTTVSAATH